MKARARFLLVLVLFSGCRQDMYNQPKNKPLSQSDVLPNGQSAQPLPPHTVAREALQLNAAATGNNADGTYVTALPVAFNAELIQRGRERFDIFCAVCHDRTGSGNGMIVQRGFPKPPSFHEPRLRNAPIGHFYDVITNGYGAMYSYAARVEPPDRWAIAAYIRALQLARGGTINDVPQQERAQLDAKMP